MKLVDVPKLIGQPGSVFLETVPRAGVPGQTLLFRDPTDIISTRFSADVLACLDRIDEAIASGFYVAGYIAYEAGAAVAGLALAPDSRRSLLWFGIYRDVARLKREDAASLGLHMDATRPVVDEGDFTISQIDYTSRIDTIKHHIREGDVYQINFTAPYRFNTSLTPVELYCRLRRRQRVDYAAMINTGDNIVLSLSPELFFKRSGNQIVTRPMKGTASRGATQEEDDKIRAALQADAKNTAENLMIVDLLRNDLSRICTPGSVETTDLFTAETYETIIQMTSTVRGKLSEGIGYRNIFEALYPSGSITGAPKLRAMEIISQLETGPRGVYCGSVGYIGPEEEAVFNVAIRTIELEDGMGSMGIGSGVVWDSDAESEYSECLLKARFLVNDVPTTRDPFVIIETMLLDRTIPLFDRHCSRLERTARHFNYPCDTQYLISEIDKISRLSNEPTKIRVELDRQGRFAIETSPYRPTADILRVVLSSSRIDSSDPFRLFKTSRRELYEAEYAAVVAEGLDEVLFLNEHGNVAEGSRTNIFIQSKEGFLTPPVESGALPGVYRQQMLDSDSQFIERNLQVEDLLEATKLYICNAVWGWREAVLVQR
ncbi:MAG: aminodeoxychorismate synthase component I [Rhodothermales bacterium]|nr:aminodeoxychorismate synthase component I [Rhodothermales bacterium]